MHVEVS